MDQSEVINGISQIPTIGWIVILFLGISIIMLGAAIIGVIFYILKTKDVKSKYLDVSTPERREMYMAEGKDLLDNQCHVAKQLVKELRIKLFIIGKNKFNLDEKDQDILELITYRITDRMNYDLKNDLTRNHITKKSDKDLISYSDGKADAYVMQIKDRLFSLNSKLRGYDLPSIMDDIPESWFKDFYRKIYFRCRDIAGAPNNQGE
ncbi:MAG: hypothetical protein MJZ37_01140 [Bacilli bacterium]|nr:hypothetical protein [Bacilli bacterium]